MAIKLRTKRPDKLLKAVANTLADYERAHPSAAIEAYRHSNVSIWIRVINAEFAGRSRAQREEEVWHALDRLTDDMLQEISWLLLFTPEEAERSLANVEFENPAPSKL